MPVKQNKARNMTIRLWSRDWERMEEIKAELESQIGRPVSFTTVVLFLLDFRDDALSASVASTTERQDS